jgi:enoyl-CoA hydratase
VTDDEVLTERDGAILVITLNRPKARNAVNSALARGLAAAVDTLDADPELSVGVLTGAGGSFCSGMDLKAFLRGELPVVEGRGFAGITVAPPEKPMIAAVEGYALAGGCEITLACDLIVAARDAKFGLPEAKRSLVAGAGGLFRLPQRIPRAIAMEYALTGEFFSAEDAHTWGLVNRVTDPAKRSRARSSWPARSLRAARSPCGPPRRSCATAATGPRRSVGRGSRRSWDRS